MQRAVLYAASAHNNDDNTRDYLIILFSYSVDYYVILYYFFFNDTATTEIYTLSLHDALPIFLPDNLICTLILLIICLLFVLQLVQYDVRKFSKGKLQNVHSQLLMEKVLPANKPRLFGQTFSTVMIQICSTNTSFTTVTIQHIKLAIF